MSFYSDEEIEEERDTAEYSVTARNMFAYYDCGKIRARSEEKAIRIAKARSGCADGLLFKARCIGRNIDP